MFTLLVVAILYIHGNGDQGPNAYANGQRVMRTCGPNAAASYNCKCGQHVAREKWQLTTTPTVPPTNDVRTAVSTQVTFRIYVVASSAHGCALVGFGLQTSDAKMAAETYVWKSLAAAIGISVWRLAHGWAHSMGTWVSAGISIGRFWDHFLEVRLFMELYLRLPWGHF